MKNAYFCIVLCWTSCVHGAITQDVVRSIQEASFDLLVDDHLEGSGIIVSASGLGFIAGHGIRQQHTHLEARSPLLGRLRLKIVAHDFGHDIALVQLPQRQARYPYRPVSTTRPGPGSSVFLYGTPLYRHGVLLKGAIARLEPSFEYLPNMGYYVEIIHVTAPSPPGTSGGAWLNYKGEVVGLQSGLMHERGAPVGIAYMSPTDALRTLLNRRVNVKTMTADAGFEEFWEQTPEYVSKYKHGQEGLVAVKVRTGGAAYQGGIREGDLLIRLGDRPIAYRDEFLRVLRGHLGGAGLKVTVLTSNGKEKNVEFYPRVIEKNP